MHLNAAAAGAHVAGRVLDLVRHGLGERLLGRLRRIQEFCEPFHSVSRIPGRLAFGELSPRRMSSRRALASGLPLTCPPAGAEGRPVRALRRPLCHPARARLASRLASVRRTERDLMIKKLFGAGLAALAALAAIAVLPSPSAAQTLDKIKSRGVLVVGTKADYKPFGFRDPSGAIVGFEPDLAKEIADKLGVKLEIEPVVSSNRMQFLQQGKIDLMIATMNDKPERRQAVGIVDPLYYASGVNVLANRKAALKSWDQLKGQKICGIQGAWYNKP